jgi:hypothetical protein
MALSALYQPSQYLPCRLFCFNMTLLGIPLVLHAVGLTAPEPQFGKCLRSVPVQTCGYPLPSGLWPPWTPGLQFPQTLFLGSYPADSVTLVATHFLREILWNLRTCGAYQQCWGRQETERVSLPRLDWQLNGSLSFLHLDT